MDRRRRLIRDLARQRVLYLIELSEEMARRGEIEYSRKYSELALEILMRTRTRLPPHLKRRICKNCHVALVPGVTATTRIRGTRRCIRIVTRCRVCGWIHRLEFRRKR